MKILGGEPYLPANTIALTFDDGLQYFSSSEKTSMSTRPG
jgi:hypothetical protein